MSQTVETSAQPAHPAGFARRRLLSVYSDDVAPSGPEKKAQAKFSFPRDVGWAYVVLLWQGPEPRRWREN